MPKKTLKLIVDKGNNYIVQVKKNQKKLFNCIEKTIECNQCISSFKSNEKSKGRKVTRDVKLFNTPVIIPEGWAQFNRIIQVERFVKNKESNSYEKSFYISSIDSDDCKLFAIGIRNHWSIENRLHWVKDVIQFEDNANIKKNNGIETLSIFKNIAINFSRQNHFDSIKEAQDFFISNVKKLWRLLRT